MIQLLSHKVSHLFWTSAMLLCTETRLPDTAWLNEWAELVSMLFQSVNENKGGERKITRYYYHLNCMLLIFPLKHFLV